MRAIISKRWYFLFYTYSINKKRYWKKMNTEEGSAYG